MSWTDPRLLAAAWANESRIAADNDETAGARRHRAEDREAAEARLRTARSVPSLLERIRRLVTPSR